jgi:hypothetical protein
MTIFMTFPAILQLKLDDPTLTEWIQVPCRHHQDPVYIRRKNTRLAQLENTDNRGDQSLSESSDGTACKEPPRAPTQRPVKLKSALSKRQGTTSTPCRRKSVRFDDLPYLVMAQVVATYSTRGVQPDGKMPVLPYALSSQVDSSLERTVTVDPQTVPEPCGSDAGSRGIKRSYRYFRQAQEDAEMTLTPKDDNVIESGDEQLPTFYAPSDASVARKPSQLDFPRLQQ